jgi:hypothetical protein
MRRPFHAMPPNGVGINPHGRLRASIRALSGITMTVRCLTDLRLSCRRLSTSRCELCRSLDITIRSNQSNRHRLPASAAC